MWGINLKRHSEVSLARQIYQTVCKQIMEGGLRSGEALPSTRDLAKQLAVSRNTVCEAYDMLLAEGFIFSRQGAPTRVAEGLQLVKPFLPEPVPEKWVEPVEEYQIDFGTGQPDLRHFPMQNWLQLLRNAAADLPPSYWGYAGPEGLPDLRQQIAAWLLRSRGLHVHPQHIFITAGATQALTLLSELLPGDTRKILMEDPCHTGMLRVFQTKGFSIHPVPVDTHGIITKDLNGQGFCAAYITPSHQFPLGGILPAERRTDLIHCARKHNFYLIEDDYDSEFRYTGPSITPLYSLDPQRVIYVGTFSKILFPGIRIGYILLPLQLQDRWREIRTYADVQNPPFAQAALAEYLRTRKLDRHIRQMRTLYGQRRKLLLELLNTTFGQTWQAWGDAAGLHLAVEFPGKRFTQNFTELCREKGIRLATVEYHSIVKKQHHDKLLLGYGHLSTEEMKHGLILLRDLILQS